MFSNQRLMTSLAYCFCFITSVSAAVTYEPIQFRAVSGIRPFVEVRMGEKPFLMMVHSNAAFVMMTTHANAQKALVTNIVHLDKYGVTSPGHLSDLGRETAVLPKLG